MCSIWHDSIIAQHILIHLHADACPEFYSFRRLNHVWHHAYHETFHFVSDKMKTATSLLKFCLNHDRRREYLSKFEFSKCLLAKHTKQLIGYDLMQYVTGVNTIRYAVKFDRWDYIMEILELPQPDVDLSERAKILLYSLKYESCWTLEHVLSYICEHENYKKLVFSDDQSSKKILNLALKICDSKTVLYMCRWFNGCRNIHYDITKLNIRDDALCNTNERKQIIDLLFDEYTIELFDENPKNCRDVYNHLVYKFGDQYRI